MSSRLLLPAVAAAALAAALVPGPVPGPAPDLTADVAQLKRKVAGLEERVARLESTGPAEQADAGAADLEAIRRETAAMEKRFGVKPAAGAELAERTWHVHVYEALAVVYSEFITVAHENGVLPDDVARRVVSGGGLDPEALDQAAVAGSRRLTPELLEFDGFEQIRNKATMQLAKQMADWGRRAGKAVDPVALVEDVKARSRPRTKALADKGTEQVMAVMEAEGKL